jgi:DNA-binding response OmpR family regulator
VIGESLAVSRKQATILLLSSDQIIRAVLQEVLEAEGYIVLPSGDLSGAVDWLTRSTPDLLIVRPYLSGMPGHEAALYLRTKCHGMRILMVGGFLEDDRLQSRSSVQGIKVFPKPFTAAEFTRKVSDVLAA